MNKMAAESEQKLSRYSEKSFTHIRSDIAAWLFEAKAI